MTKPASLRVVVVDNDPDALDLVEMDLRLTGHEIVGTALQGDEAIALCERHRPDVLVTDYRMPPGPNGVEVAAAIRDRCPEVGVIVYTNYRDATLQARVEEQGATILAKGDIRALRRLVETVGAADHA